MYNNKENGFSLKTQIYGLVVFLGFISFIGSLLISVEHTKDYLNDQMGSHAQDTATSLGLSISPYLSNENLIITETMVSAIFDSGYYASIELVAPDDKTVLISRYNPKTVDKVPNWFIDMFELSPPSRESEVHNGWQIAGTLKVTSHAGVSYYQLWQYGSKAFIAFAIILFVSLLLAYFILNAVLQPLMLVEKQAVAVSKKQFIINPKQPFTRELKVVVNALNTMVENVQNNFNSLTRQAENITKEAYLDKLTSLGNRRAFNSQFNAHLNEMDADDIGTIALIELPSLQKVNLQFGYQTGDEYVLTVIDTVQSAFSGISALKLYRINGGSFIMTIAQPVDICQQEIQKLLADFSQLNSDKYPDGFAKLVVSTYKKLDPLKKLLSDLDTLLTQESSTLSSTIDGNNSAFVENNGLSLGLQQWHNLIDDILQAGDIHFLFQPVKALNTAQQTTIKTGNFNSLYDELLAKFSFNKQVIPNNQLFSMAERLNLTEQLDKKLITAAVGFITEDIKQPLAINLSQQSLLSESFRLWLTTLIAKNPLCRKNLFFEINETSLLKNIGLATKHISIFKSLDIGICIERFGTSFTSFKYLRGLDLDYIKIDGSYVRDLSENSDNNYFIQAVNQICHGLGIKVIACHIESDEILTLVKTLECDAYQGQHIQAPMPFE